ncbi:hypothetical protein VTK73DRAFT_3636 [Phialemonium thermophilum]|uniref:Uncharacterized protein n=1 Tax=Phialemonium thermophilum TaxID=223376 RepID=A0ABR3WYB8_9PEZI
MPFEMAMELAKKEGSLLVDSDVSPSHDFCPFSSSAATMDGDTHQSSGIAGFQRKYCASARRPISSSTSSRRFPTASSSGSLRQTASPPPEDPFQDGTPSPTLKRSATFKLPLKINTDPSVSTFSHRPRAPSLGQQQTSPEKRHAYRSSSSSSSSIPISRPLDPSPPRSDTRPATRLSSGSDQQSRSGSRPPSEQFAATKVPLSSTQSPVTEKESPAGTISSTTVATTPPPRSPPSPVQGPLRDSVLQSSTMSAQPVKIDLQGQGQGQQPAAAKVAINGLSAPNVPLPNLSGQANGVVGNLLKGPVTADGKLKDAALMVGIKLDLEAEVHVTARVRGDILVGLY